MKTKLLIWTILLLSTALHFQYFTRELTGFHVWRQTQTQSTIDNFYEEDMNILNPRKNDRGNGDGIFRMEFPLMQWSIAVLYHVFGNHLLVTRICMFLISLCSIIGIYKLVSTLFSNNKMGLIAAWALSFSPCFFYYAVNPLPDNMALCFAIWALVYFWKWLKQNQTTYLLTSGLLLALSTLCKLPFVLYYAAPIAYLCYLLYKQQLSSSAFIKYALLISWAILFPAIWYIKVIPTWHHTDIDTGLFNNTESWSTILNYLQGNLISVLPELLLNYGSLPLFIAGFYFCYRKGSYQHPYFIGLLGLSLMVLVYFLFEINQIGVMHDYYLMPFLPLLFIIVGYGGFNLYSQNKFGKTTVMVLLLILPITCLLRLKSRWDPNSVGFNKDFLTYKTELRNIIPDNSLCVVGNDESHFIQFYFLHKKGWAFDNDMLDAQILKDYTQQGAQYLFYDGDKPSEHFGHSIDSLILQQGSVRVYKLK